jgi:ornithine decarboxylase
MAPTRTYHDRRAVSERIERFIRDVDPPTPYLVIDHEVVVDQYLRLEAALPPARIFYAVKANPEPEILRVLAREGSCFDVASVGEIDACLAAGATVDRLSYGNTVKRARDIAYAHSLGIRRFTVDAIDEVHKVLANAPGAEVVVRLFHDGGGADWPLSRKFGCEPHEAVKLLAEATFAGASRTGISFHVGSQQRSPQAWDQAIAATAEVFAEARELGASPDIVNLGGGFPAHYVDQVPAIAVYGAAIMGSLQRHFGDALPEIMAEPGRYMVADAGLLRTEVVLVSDRSLSEKRWVYLDCGKFGGLAETMDEAIRYRLRTAHDGGPTCPVVLAGPTCDSADVLYEKADYELPVALRDGDRLDILSTGAYTTTYSAVGFNGFPPLRAHVI